LNLNKKVKGSGEYDTKARKTFEITDFDGNKRVKVKHLGNR